MILQTLIGLFTFFQTDTCLKKIITINKRALFTNFLSYRHIQQFFLNKTYTTVGQIQNQRFESIFSPPPL